MKRLILIGVLALAGCAGPRVGDVVAVEPQSLQATSTMTYQATFSTEGSDLFITGQTDPSFEATETRANVNDYEGDWLDDVQVSDDGTFTLLRTYATEQEFYDIFAPFGMQCRANENVVGYLPWADPVRYLQDVEGPLEGSDFLAEMTVIERGVDVAEIRSDHYRAEDVTSNDIPTMTIDLWIARDGGFVTQMAITSDPLTLTYTLTALDDDVSLGLPPECEQ